MMLPRHLELIFEINRRLLDNVRTRFAGDDGIGELLSDLSPTCATPEIRVDCPDEEKFKITGKLADYFRSRDDVTEIDGVRVNFENGWGLVRASNTQPALVLRFEATDEAGLSEIRILFESKLRELGGI
jgi:phosphomannomutase/phosphoglucomutase